MYELALAFSPGCAEAHNNLGVVLRELGQLERAVECYQAALALRPNFPQSLNNLGVVMTAQGNAAQALALLTAAVAACPTYAGKAAACSPARQTARQGQRQRVVLNAAKIRTAMRSRSACRSWRQCCARAAAGPAAQYPKEVA